MGNCFDRTKSDKMVDIIQINENELISNNEPSEITAQTILNEFITNMPVPSTIPGNGNLIMYCNLTKKYKRIHGKCPCSNCDRVWKIIDQ